MKKYQLVLYNVPGTKYKVGIQLRFEFFQHTADLLVKDLCTLYFVLGTSFLSLKKFKPHAGSN